MKPFVPKPAVVQLTDHLRDYVLSREVGESMPGVNQLVHELGVGTQTVIEAIFALENEGLLENQGARRGRRITRGPVGGIGRGFEGADPSL